MARTQVPVESVAHVRGQRVLEILGNQLDHLLARKAAKVWHRHQIIRH